ncbi:plasmid replication protein RepC [Mesobacterium sp. TK19101]|uniref:Plasmid replication protein RepC n=1 Tax=Mesobacterium hydrothermale TaxID=3111907 RepID=A0ABU6HL47_9RHOB|nr:plasmid replication protein RepC [Mesobacterium sp. TK19101]MEC3862812.1 plasmid replication protein RepC [Mesobacterium sp. TK19101]
MTQMSRIASGQPVDLCPAPDKWSLLDALTRVARDHGLNHRSLSVLKALLSFFPDRALPRDPGAAVVFPSNRTLSLRLNGMPESTLRRHLATLVKSGVITRQDSANRKRFARRGGLAFGFDLSPLARAATALFQAADAATEQQDRIAALRDRLAATRARLRESGALPDDHPAMDAARLTLRRKSGEAALRAQIATLESFVDTPLRYPTDPEKTSGRNSQNERHIQKTDKEESVYKSTPTDESDSVALTDVLDHCKEYKSYFPDTPGTWTGVLRTCDRLHGMMGIDRPVYEDAQRRLGVEAAAITILCMLERITTIRNPGAYLRGLVQRAASGRFNLGSMVRGVARGRLSADNFA